MVLYLFLILVLLIFIRWIFIFITAFFQFIDRKKQKQRLFALLKQKGWPPISIVIPAYNEEKMISAVIEAILATDYPEYEIIVVNDASSDNTLQLIKQYENKFDKVHVISNNINKGKALSLNVGIQSAKHEVIIAIDADTILMKKTLKYLVLPLLCEEISATASNLKIGNNHFLLTILQSIEYITGLNLDRRAQSFLNCITTLPGAASAYKRSALKKVGYFSNDTMAEDADLTLGLLVNGYKLVFEDKALVYTEAPISIKDLYKQRFRWLHGNISCIWKYRQFLFKTTNKTFLWFGFPNFIFNNFLIFLFIPFMFFYNVDLFYNFSFWKLEMLLAFILLDISMSIFAYFIDNGTKNELFYAIIQRPFYLFFFQFIFFSVILAFIGKRKTSWNKVTRSGKWLNKG